MSPKEGHPHKKLNQFLSTSVCGNDILSSALYVSGIAAMFAGVYSPLILIFIALVLLFYKSVYREVVEALPINGGAYNALLNGTTKNVAAIAGVMTVLSYVATAVLSAKTAIEYLFRFLETVIGHAELLQTLVIPSVILILFLFALLVIFGVKDSAYVATGIFSFHIISLLLFVSFGFYAITHGMSFFQENVKYTSQIVLDNNGLLATLFLAFSACLLGVSGFESSANFVEEQEHGVFKKTLRNMLIGVAVFNPLISLVILNVSRLPDIIAAKDFVLADAALRIGGVPFLALISIDAFLVLCGAVLTSYIGVTGLIRRMSLDECLPFFLLKQNTKGSNPRVIFSFFLLTSSILIITKGNLLSLAGVYTISFLSVMTLFAFGNLILRKTRAELKRQYHAPVIFVFLAAIFTLIGIVGNASIDKMNVVYFSVYFIPAILIVFAVVYKKEITRVLAGVFSFYPPLNNYFMRLHRKFVESTVYVFLHHVDHIYESLDYIHKNENAHFIRLVHCGDDKEDINKIKETIPTLKQAGVFPHFKIFVDFLPEEFGPHAIDIYAKRRKIPKNRIFIGSIHESHNFDYSDLGGVRIISE